MKCYSTYSHHHGIDVFKCRNLYRWAKSIFTTPKITVQPGSTKAIRNHTKSELTANGWGLSTSIDAELDLKILARKEDMAFQLQTGNISRYAYDLLKIQHLFLTREVECAILAVPTKEAANKLGSNIAHADRICPELNVFDRIVTVPIMVIAFG